MAGYDWNNGKSNNAVSCEKEGKVNKSQITKSMLEIFDIDLTVKQIKDLIENGFIKSCEWHHTSKFFNCTDYYDLEQLAEDLKEDKSYYENALNEIKNKKEDIIYAKIVVTYIDNVGSKRTPRYKREEKIYIAKVKGYYSNKSLCTIRTFDDEFKKSEKYIKVINIITEDEYNQVCTNLKKEKDKKEKAEIKKQRETLIILAEPLNNDEVIKKIKKTKVSYDFWELERDIKEALKFKIKQDKEKEKVDKITAFKDNAVDFMEVEKWISLPKEQRHPSPKNVFELKEKSGLSWGAFELAIKNEI